MLIVICFVDAGNRDLHGVVLPSWINNNMKFGAETQGVDPALNSVTYDPYELESARTNDLYWNDIQKFLTEHRYLHPLLVVYWSYRILQWSVSSQSAITVSRVGSVDVYRQYSRYDIIILGINTGDFVCGPDDRVLAQQVRARIKHIARYSLHGLESAVSSRKANNFT